jgi:hypothetical protein
MIERAVSLAIVAVLCLSPAVAAAKKKHGEAVTACQQRIAEKIKADHPPSQGSSFDGQVQRDKNGENAVTIRGSGRVRTAKNKNRGFSYSCVYNHRNGKLSKVKYSIH